MSACSGYPLTCWLPKQSLSVSAGPRLAAVEEVLDLILAERAGALRAVAARPIEPLLNLHGVAGVCEELRLQGRLRALARLVRACGGRERLSLPACLPGQTVHGRTCMFAGNVKHGFLDARVVS